MKRWILIIVFLALLLWSIPYLVANFVAGDDWFFNGFLLNPIDGLSYLAKMQIGMRGEWRFSLPYTAETSQGAYIFLFYIGLGHLARVLTLSPVLIFHFARLIAGLFMLWAIWAALGKSIKNTQKDRILWFSVITFGSGLGWIASPFLGVTSDLWVAEAYPFLAGYTNPHFPLGIGLLVRIISQSQDTPTWRWRSFQFLRGIALSIIMPFGIVVAVVILVGGYACKWRKSHRIPVEQCFWPLIGGGAFLVYQYLAIISDPILNNWNLQNITISPPWWDFLVSFSPALIFAGIGLWKKRNQLSSELRTLIVAWLILGGILIHIPFALQRRFLLGFYIPSAILALDYLKDLKPAKLSKRALLVFLIVSFLTNGLVILVGSYGITSRNPNLFLTRHEVDGLNWLRDNTPAQSLILASPQMGTAIPAFTPHRVIYGHPFETVDAKNEENLVKELFSDSMLDENALKNLKQKDVRYIFFGPREKVLGKPDYLRQLKTVYENPEIQIFCVCP